MAIKTKRKTPTPANFGSGVSVNTCFKQQVPSPKEQVEDLRRQLQHAEQRSDIETVAMKAAELVREISEARNDIAGYENALRNRRERLSAALLEHQLTVAKFKELAAVPQPTA
jgi:hypothetical protein